MATHSNGVRIGSVAANQREPFGAAWFDHGISGIILEFLSDRSDGSISVYIAKLDKLRRHREPSKSDGFAAAMFLDGFLDGWVSRGLFGGHAPSEKFSSINPWDFE